MKPNRFSTLRSSRAVEPLKPKSGGMAGLEDMFLGSLADGMTRIGALSSAKTGSDWTSKTIELVPGTRVTARLPSAPIVEIDGMTLVAEMVKAADAVFPKIAQALQAEKSNPANVPNMRLPAHDLLGIVLGDGYSRADIVVAVVRKVLVAQSWKFIPSFNRWQSPMWLFPPIMLRWETLEEMVREEVKMMEMGKLLVQVQDLDDHVPLPTEE